METNIVRPLIFTLLLFCFIIFQTTLFAQWYQVGQDIEGEAAGDESGLALSVSNDGSTIAIGAPYNDGNAIDAGHVRVYHWNGVAWVQQGVDIYGEAAGDSFGGSVDLSDNGSTIAVGAPYNDGNGVSSGHVRVYDWDGVAWGQRGADIDGEATSDVSGVPLIMSNNGNALAIGASMNNGNGVSSGHVRVYDWNGFAWVQRGVDIDGEMAGDEFGLAIDFDKSSNVLVVGARLNDGNGVSSGHVRVYDWNGVVWVQRGGDIDGEVAGDESGYSVSISSNGMSIVIGAHLNDGNGSDAGHVQIYDWNGITWIQRGIDIDGEAVDDRLGYSVSISGNGNSIVSAATQNDGNGSDAGHVQVYDWNGAVWVQRGVDIDGEGAGDWFGYLAKMSDDGRTIAVSARFNDGNGNNSGHVRIFRYSGVYGHIYQDFNQNCTKDIGESGFERNLVVNPGNIIVQTNPAGTWALDSLPAGNYTITVDTSGNWQPTCPTTQSFTVVHPDSITVAPSFGFISTAPCPSPDISIQAPFLRPGFSNQQVHVQACNQAIGTDILDSAYVVVELDSLLMVDSCSFTYTSLGNNQYRVDVGDLYPNQCADFYFDCTISTNAILGQSLCMQADLYPVDSCSLDSVPDSIGIAACNTPYDNSHIILRGVCVYDTIKYTVINAGSGNMTCFSPVRLYIDGEYILLDSVQLQSGQDTIFAFVGDGRTWRLEVDQHPLHPGNSQPSSTIELCGNASNWTPNLVNILPHDDADPIRDIFCGVVTGSYDPNDKRGFPLGITNNHHIDQNQEIDYTIRFQNTGTDTAFTVVIRDTLPMELDIFSVRSGAASHNYEFRMYGPRVLEWTFPYIYLVDSTTNEPESHGFVSFKVRQNQNLPIGTTIENNAGIYFDFNAPIITNKTLHTIGLPQDLTWDGQQIINSAICGPYTFNGTIYTQAGTYWNAVQNGALDSLYTLNLSEVNTTVLQNGINLTATSATGASYQWIDCNSNQPIIGETNVTYTATANGNYAVEITDNGCVDTSVCYSITVVGLDDIENAAWQLYPNPTKGDFKITLDQVYNDIHVRVLDVQGRVVAIKEYAQQQYLDLSIDQAVGLYFVQVYTNQQEAVFKVLKK